MRNRLRQRPASGEICADGWPSLPGGYSAAMMEVYRRILTKTAKRGQFAGVHCIAPEYGVQMAAMGFRLITLVSDALLMTLAARGCLGRFRKSEGKA